MQFEWIQFEERDAVGNVTGVGISWCEARVWAEWLLHKIAEGAYWLGLIAVVPGIGFGLTHGASVAVPIFTFAALLLGVAYAFIWMGWRVPASERWIVFRTDGTISSSEEGTWRTRVADVANIEWEELKKRKDEDELPYTHGVRMVTWKRRVLKVAKNLEPDDAGTLAYALSGAKEVVRFAGANGIKLTEKDVVW